jgi:hypothetical protein
VNLKQLDTIFSGGWGYIWQKEITKAVAEKHRVGSNKAMKKQKLWDYLEKKRKVVVAIG